MSCMHERMYGESTIESFTTLKTEENGTDEKALLIKSQMRGGTGEVRLQPEKYRKAIEKLQIKVWILWLVMGFPGK